MRPSYFCERKFYSVFIMNVRFFLPSQCFGVKFHVNIVFVIKFFSCRPKKNYVHGVFLCEDSIFCLPSQHFRCEGFVFLPRFGFFLPQKYFLGMNI